MSTKSSKSESSKKSSEKAVEKAVEKGSEKGGEKGADKATDKVADKTTDKVTDKTKHKPVAAACLDQYTLSTVANPESPLLNRELSWLAFNDRVLAEARDPRNPLLERLKYAAICGSNLDEFFMVRVAGIHRQIAAGVHTPGPDGLLPRETLKLVRERTHAMLREVGKASRDALGELAKAGVVISKVDELGKGARAAVREHYLAEIQPVLTPLIVDPGHPFPYLSNLSLNLAVILKTKKGEEPDFARVKIPVGILPRVVRVGEHLLMLEDVIAAHVDELFKGRKVQDVHVFRLTRNTDYELEEDEAEDLLATIEDALRRRRFGSAVRLEVERSTPRDILEFLQDNLNLNPEDLFLLDGPLGTADLMGLPIDRPDLAYPRFAPAIADLDGEDDAGVFDTLSHGDVLMHHPYDSFSNVLDFLDEAARDPQVLAIKQTLYRTGDDPRLLGALRTAAENGKQVVAMIELKARFDEQRNISWARKLERAGAHVVYGMVGLKTHAKVTMVVRREEGGLRRYVHIGTGNYNPKTARLYTDLSLLTSHPEIGADVAELFNHLTASATAEYTHLLVAPDTARSGFEALIEREIEHAQAGRHAWIRAKFNQLTDPGMIEALYRASSAGVKVELVIRGVCCLRPGVPGVSENIQVHSLLGRYLEHARIYAFGNGGLPEVYFGSADWMSRNLDRRVEVIAPVLDDKHRAAYLSIFKTEWHDQRGSWVLHKDGRYQKIAGDLSAQAQFSEARNRA